MEFLAHYRSPYIAADEIRISPASNGLILRQDDRELQLDIEGNVESARNLLDELRMPQADVWGNLREDNATGLCRLIDQLDRLGWIKESDQQGRIQCTDEREGLDTVCNTATNWLIHAYRIIQSEQGTPASEYASALIRARNESKYLWTERNRGRLTSAAAHKISPRYRDIAEGALRLLLISWQRTSPVTLQVVTRALEGAWSAIIGQESGAEEEAWDSIGVHMADPKEVKKQVWGAMVLVVMAESGAWSSRYSKYLPKQAITGPALNVLVAAENCAERLLLELGPSPLLEVLNRQQGAIQAAPCIYLHQHFITIRYIEAILAFLRYRLREPIRDVGFRYLWEEQGHEVHELEACLQLGLTAVDVGDFAPFPLFMAYPEVLGLYAEANPLTFGLAITVAEGMPGTNKPIAQALDAQGVRGESLSTHQQIDIDLDHEQFTRRLLHHIPWIEADVAADALEDFLFVVELSQLAWWQIANYSIIRNLPRAPKAFALSPEQVLSLWGVQLNAE